MASTDLRPTVFVGSSTAGLNVARAVQQQLQGLRKVALVQIWNELSASQTSHVILDTLVSKLTTFDFGVLVFTPDDPTQMEGKEMFAPRDNVLVELGLCIGLLSRERTFVLRADDSRLKIPSDLGGIIYGKFKLESDREKLVSEVSPACDSIETAIQNVGKLNSINRLASEVELKTSEQNQRLDQQERIIDNMVRYGMSISIFRHLAGIVLLKEYTYHDNDANRREFYFLRDAGYIKPRQGDFIDFNRDLDGVNLIDRAEPTPIGSLCVRLRRNDIPPEMISDTWNLRVHPDEIRGV
jgi:hypothetical protein